MKEWRQESPSSYHAAWYLGLLKKCGAHMERPKWKYSKEEVRKIAETFETRQNFSLGNPGAYHFAWKTKILEEICSHMSLPYSTQKGRNYNGKDYSVYAIEFSDKSVYVGLTISLERRFHEHVVDDKSGVAKHCAQTGAEILAMKEIMGGLRATDAQVSERLVAQKYEEEGWTLLSSKRRFGQMGSRNPYSNLELLSIAKKYRTITALIAKKPNIYVTIKRRKLSEEAFAHMKVLKKKWTLELALEEGRKYESRTEWQRASNRSYTIVRMAGLLDTVIADKFIRWNEKMVWIQKKRYRTHTEWSKKSPGSYNFWKNYLRNNEK